MTPPPTRGGSGQGSAGGDDVHRRCSFTDTSLCGYPIHVRWHEEGRVDQWFDAHGNLIRLVVHHVFTEVDRANGKVATGIDREKLTSDERDTYTQTGSWIFFLPNHRTFRRRAASRPPSTPVKRSR